MGRLTGVTDAKSNNTGINYDSLGRKTSMTDPDMGAWSYSYYPNNLLKTVKDAKQQIITYTYDPLSRPKTKSYPDQSSITYVYDENGVANGLGRLTSVINSANQSIVRYSYDQVGRIAGNSRTIDGASYSLAYNYANGRLASVTYPDNESVSYGYNGPYLQQVTGYVAYSNFDALGHPWNAAYGAGGASMSATYDSVTKRLASLSVSSPQQGLLINNSYTYDNKGNITGIDDFFGDMLPTNPSVETYTPVRAHAVGATGSGRQFQYDANGNMTSDGVRSIAYNYDNMPIAINNVSFDYDGTGSRIKKTSPIGTTVYIDKLYACTNGGCSKYIFDGNGPVAIKSGAVVLYYHPDHHGSIVAVTDANGNRYENSAYYPFGETRQDNYIVNDPNSQNALKYKYTGQELDGETGLYNYNARLYDPDLGRFITPDSIVPDQMNPQSLNRYAYVRNNPINLNDPTGHDGDGGDNTESEADELSSSTTVTGNGLSSDNNGVATATATYSLTTDVTNNQPIGTGAGNIATIDSNGIHAGGVVSGLANGVTSIGGFFSGLGGGEETNGTIPSNNEGDQIVTILGLGTSHLGTLFSTASAVNPSSSALGLVADIALNSASIMFGIAPNQRVSDIGGFISSTADLGVGMSLVWSSIRTNALTVIATNTVPTGGLMVSAFGAGLAVGNLINHLEVPHSGGLNIEQAITKKYIYHQSIW